MLLHISIPLRVYFEERKGFEPSVHFHVHMISNHAQSTTLAPLYYLRKAEELTPEQLDPLPAFQEQSHLHGTALLSNLFEEGRGFEPSAPFY